MLVGSSVSFNCWKKKKEKEKRKKENKNWNFNFLIIQNKPHCAKNEVSDKNFLSKCEP